MAARASQPFGPPGPTKDWIRISTNPTYYEQHAEAMELWSPGNPTFPAVSYDVHHATASAIALEALERIAAAVRKNYLFCGSGAGGQRAACLYTIIATAKLNGLNPEA